MQLPGAAEDKPQSADRWRRKEDEEELGEEEVRGVGILNGTQK